MGGLLIIGIIRFVCKLAEQASWNTNAYAGKELDINQMFIDTNVNMTLGKMSKADVKHKYRNGGYVKK